MAFGYRYPGEGDPRYIRSPTDPKDVDPNADPYTQSGQAQTSAQEPRSSQGMKLLEPSRILGPTEVDQRANPINSLLPTNAPVQSAFEAQSYRIGAPPGVAPAQDGAFGSLYATAGNLYSQDRASVGEVAGLNRANLTPLAQAAAGQVPSAAELQGRAALEASQRATMSAAVTGRGGGGAQRAAVLAQSQQGLLAGQEAARLRADEQARAREVYLQAIGQQGAIAGQYMDASGQYQDSLTAIEEMRQQGLISDQEAYLAAEQINADIYNNATNANAQVATANLDVAAERDETRRRNRNKTIGGLAAAFGGPLGFAFNAGFGKK